MILNLQSLSEAGFKGEMDILEQFLNILDSRSQLQHAVNKYEEYCHVKPDVYAINIIQ